MRFGAICLVLLFAVVGFAHDLGLSGIRLIHRSQDCVLSVMVHQSKLQAGDLEAQIRRRLKVQVNGQPYSPGKVTLIRDDAADTVVLQSIIRGSVKSFVVEQRLFPEQASSQTLVSVVKDGQTVSEVILDAKHPSQVEVPPLVAAGRFLVKGVEHILSGADHVLFVLGLLLLGGNLKSLAKTVTAFTLAHSITLTLAVTGLLNPPSRVVEPLIALSIVAIAIENLREKKVDTRPLVAFGFGLIHGFGFAGALSEVGLSGGALLSALVSFNVGVELGQACIILVAFPLILWLTRRFERQWQRFAVAGSVLIGLVGSYWFVERILG